MAASVTDVARLKTASTHSTASNAPTLAAEAPPPQARPLTGNEAIARGAWEAGVRVAAAYPGTPSTEILESLARYPAEDIQAQWSTNEKVALDVAIGASFAGVRAMASMKHVGLNVAADALMSLTYIGVNGGPGHRGVRRSRHPQLAERAGHAAVLPARHGALPGAGGRAGGAGIHPLRLRAERAFRHAGGHPQHHAAVAHAQRRAARHRARCRRRAASARIPGRT